MLDDNALKAMGIFFVAWLILNILAIWANARNNS